jgi:hypothetical protein
MVVRPSNPRHHPNMRIVPSPASAGNLSAQNLLFPQPAPENTP